MDIDIISNLISSVGFPIAVCIALFWKLNRDEERHTEELSKMTEAINNNTQAITELSVRLGIGGE